MDWRGWVGLCVSLGVGCSSAPPEPQGSPASGPQTVILISIDTLRGDHLPWVSPSADLPWLTAFGESGATFSRTFAPSSLTPISMASLFTGLYPPSHGIVRARAATENGLNAEGHPILPEANVTLAERFAAAGYTTVGIGSNGHLSSHFGFSQGFGTYNAGLEFIQSGNSVNFAVTRTLSQRFGPTWRQRWREEKVFLWIHYFDPHSPYYASREWLEKNAPDVLTSSPSPRGMTEFQLLSSWPQPPPPLVQRQLRDLYRGEVALMDGWLASLWQQISPPDDALVVITSDHGEAFYEHNKLGHNHDLHKEATHVPLAIRWPGHIRPGVHIEAPTSLLDVYPTLLSLAGLDPTPGIQGLDLSPAMKGEPLPVRTMLGQLARPGAPHRSLQVGLERLLIQEDGETPLHYYDLATDPQEKVNLVEARPERTQELLTQLEAAFAALPTREVSYYTISDPAMLEQLKAMGYIDP